MALPSLVGSLCSIVMTEPGKTKRIFSTLRRHPEYTRGLSWKTSFRKNIKLSHLNIKPSQTNLNKPNKSTQKSWSPFNVRGIERQNHEEYSQAYAGSSRVSAGGQRFWLLLITSIQFPTVPIFSCFPQSYKDFAYEQENVISTHNLHYLGKRSMQTLDTKLKWTLELLKATLERQNIGQPKPNTAVTTPNINKEAHLNSGYLFIFTLSYTSSRHLKTLKNIYEIMQNSEK